MDAWDLLLAGAGGMAALGFAGYWFGMRPIIRPGPAETGFELADDELEAARRFMAAHPIIDSHAHPGRTFLKGAENLDRKIAWFRRLGGTFEDRALEDMKAGGLDAAIFNGVADIQVLTLGAGDLVANRAFRPGEAWASCQRQIANLAALADRGEVRICRTAADVLAAKQAGQRGAILAMEGADFLETDLSRLQAVHAAGVRMITLVHYRDNTVGDIMTGPVGNRGLTDFGRRVVRAMNETGLMIDLAHASEKTTLEALAITRQPAVITHTHIETPELSHPRFISEDVALAVAETGGYIGAWPAGIGMSSLAEFVDRIDFLIETVGEDHVALGSDMDANYRPVLETYRKMPLLVGMLLRRGHSEERLAKIMGGNVLRVMDAVQA